jgi:hypothetical protein
MEDSVRVMSDSMSSLGFEMCGSRHRGRGH